VSLVLNDRGELLAALFIPGNVDERQPVSHLARRLWGKLFGDRGCLSHTLFERLWGQGAQLVTRLKKKMKNALLPLLDKILLRNK
jgi:hypothetical protein